MTYKDLLIHLDGSPASDARMRGGLALAAAWRAHLTGL
ncbi:MAG: universal stress protein, partial [Tabrizicola sp.]|nr:universal stress protein [Tabrizicola sp.]